MNQLVADHTTKDGLTLDRLQQCKLMLKERDNKYTNQEILALVEDSVLEDEIQQADVLKKR